MKGIKTFVLLTAFTLTTTTFACPGHYVRPQQVVMTEAQAIQNCSKAFGTHSRRFHQCVARVKAHANPSLNHAHTAHM